MAISEAYSGTASLTVGVETTLNTVDPDTTDGVYQLFVDTSGLSSSGVLAVLEIRVKEKVVSGGTQRTVFTSVLTNAASTDNAIWVSPSLILMHGWSMTLKQTGSGLGSSIPWSIRVVA